MKSKNEKESTDKFPDEIKVTLPDGTTATMNFVLDTAKIDPSVAAIEQAKNNNSIKDLSLAVRGQLAKK